LNFKNFWTGEWLSCWELEKLNETEFTLKGHVRANTYYYEEGNIQFNLKTEFNEKLNCSSDEESFAKDVIKIIETKENNVCNNKFILKLRFNLI
jgi:hypothetical protein